MPKTSDYQPFQSKFQSAKLPALEVVDNHYSDRDYVVRFEIPEFNCICPKTGLPDFGVLYVRYMPARRCLELKSLKEYILEYRNLGIFQENVVNRVLDDVVKAARPVWAVVRGEFNRRGGLGTTIEARYPRPRK